MTDCLLMHTLQRVTSLMESSYRKGGIQPVPRVSLAKVIRNTTLVSEGLWIGFSLLARVVIVGGIALVFLLVGQGGVCAFITLLCLGQCLELC